MCIVSLGISPDSQLPLGRRSCSTTLGWGAGWRGAPGSASWARPSSTWGARLWASQSPGARWWHLSSSAQCFWPDESGIYQFMNWSSISGNQTRCASSTTPPTCLTSPSKMRVSSLRPSWVCQTGDMSPHWWGFTPSPGLCGAGSESVLSLWISCPSLCSAVPRQVWCSHRVLTCHNHSQTRSLCQ